MDYVKYTLYPHVFRFVTAERFEMDTHIVWPGEGLIEFGKISLKADGLLTIEAGFPWDGASGPIVQTPDLIRGSLVHDALYALMREQLLPDTWRLHADELLRTMCIADGMPHWQAEMVYAAVRARGTVYAQPTKPAPVLIAPVPAHYPSAAEQVAP